MKLHVVHDQQGNIIAASKEGENSPVPHPASAQHTYHQFDLPAHLENLEVQDIVGQVYIDTASQKLIQKQ